MPIDWTMRDNPAAAQLRTALHRAARDLVLLAQPVVVAACPNKFDDMGHYPDWLGAQVGSATWERSDYGFQDRPGDIREHAHKPEEVAAARAVLERLQAEGWCALAERAFGLAFREEVLAVVRQHDATWLLVSASNVGVDAAFLLRDRGEPIHVGAACRLDERLGRSRPMLLERINPDRWRDIVEAAPRFPFVTARSTGTAERAAARRQLSDLLQAEFGVLRGLPGEVRYAAAAGADPDYHWYPGAWRAVALDSLFISRSFATVDDYKKAIDLRGQLAPLDAMLDRLEHARWRELFGQVVAPLADDEALGMLARGDEAWLIAAQSAVFSLVDGELARVGICDRIWSADTAASAQIYRFGSPAR